jgi:hypothetical protein
VVTEKTRSVADQLASGVISDRRVQRETRSAEVAASRQRERDPERVRNARNEVPGPRTAT